MKIYPVILSGGAGTRLWPLSRAVLPKQLLPIVADKTMLQDTALRVAGLPGLMAPLVVCGNDHRFMVAEQLRAAGITPLGILLEPVGRNTAPAVAAAAHYLKSIDPEAVMLVLPADHVIDNTEAFRDAVTRAASLVKDGGLATFGIVPQSPETGYGLCRRWRLLLEQRHVHVRGRAIPRRAGQVCAGNRRRGREGRDDRLPRPRFLPSRR
jgi:mannose-1-phosphate guanylyltransferase/mannose-6-phosphate isomerase